MKKVKKQKNNIKIEKINEDNIEVENEEINQDNVKEEIEDIKENKSEEKISKSNKKKRLFFIIPIILILVCLIVFGYFYFSMTDTVKNVVVKNKDFHEIEISWDKLDKNINYVILISSNKFTNEEVDEYLKDGKFNSDYQVIEIKNDNKLKYDMVMSNTDYYISVIAYKNSGKVRKYYKSSKVVKIHTNSLKINKITDLSVEDSTDTSVKLKWSLYDTLFKNLDGTDIDISYTLFFLDSDINESIELEKDIKEGEYYISDLKPFTKYFYKIVVNAYVDGNIVNSDDSDILEVITMPAPVSGISSKSGGTSSISLNWNEYDKSNLENADASITYSVYGSDSEDGEYTLLEENITDTSYTESGLTQNKTRYYYVTATIEINNEKYVSIKSDITSSTTDREFVSNNWSSNNNSSSSNNNSSSGGNSSSSSTSSGELTAAEKNAQARVIAKQIASSVLAKGYTTDIEKVQDAASQVSAYYYQGVHKESGNDYYTAYGVFIKKESSCAGTTRALGMVLEEMGYKWVHANENLWTHQWVILIMDGQVGYADGQVGWVGYGSHITTCEKNCSI